MAHTLNYCQKGGTVIFKEQAEWYSTAWYNDVYNWIAGRTAENKLRVIGAISEIKATDLSLVLRVPTDQGDIYFKATTGAASHEARLSLYLYRLLGQKVSSIIATDEQRHWLLMRDIGGRRLRELRDEMTWKRAIEDYASIQLLMVAHVDALISMGVPDRRLPVLRQEIEQHLAGMCSTGLSSEETVNVMALQPELMRMCDQIDGSIPASLDHGDLHSANIHVRDEEVVFFDWGDASVTHPFFSTAVFWNALEELVDSESVWPQMVQKFKPYYLAAWSKYTTQEELARMSAISDQLASVYRALSWYLYINPTRKDVKDTYRRPAQWLQILLDQRRLTEESSSQS